MYLLQTKASFLELRKAIKDNKGYILGHFSYADVTMAVALQAVEPVGPPISKYVYTPAVWICNALYSPGHPAQNTTIRQQITLFREGI